MDTRFEANARANDAVGVLQQSVLNGALWAVGSSWAYALREMTRALLPNDTVDIVLAELLAATLTTLLALGVTFAVTRPCCYRTHATNSVHATPGGHLVSPRTLPTRAPPRLPTTPFSPRASSHSSDRARR